MKNSFMLKVLRVGEPKQPMRVNSSEHPLRYWNAVVKRQSWFDENKEHLVALVLSTKHEIQGYSLVSIGSVDETIAHPREIFRAAVASGAYGIVVMHNHPSGNPAPSPSDRELIKRLNEGGQLLGIRVIDHIVVGKSRTYYSFAEEEAAIAEKNRRRPRSRRKSKR